MLRQTIAAALLCGFAAAASGYDYAAGTGALSYTFFNLSPYPWTLQPYRVGSNTHAATSPATDCGWIGCATAQTSGTWTTVPSFFDYYPFQGNSCDQYTTIPNPLVTGNYIFYYWMEDPIAYAPPGTKTVATGTSYPPANPKGQLPPYPPHVETAIAAKNTLNAPAIGDSWYLSPTTGSGIVFAGMAAAPNMLVSGITDSSYPYCLSLQGAFPNYAINPVAPIDFTGTQTTEAGSSTYTVYNNYGAGFVGATQALNYNSSSNTQTGGMWAGLNNPNPNNLAVNALNMAMPALNLSNYVTANDVNSGLAQYTTSIYGAHYTLAVGDPFVISSFAAKILWYIVTSNGYAFSNESLSTGDLGTLQGLVVPSAGNGVFYQNSYASDYAAWLLASPAAAQSTLADLDTAASNPVTRTTIWGKILGAAFELGLDIAIPELGLAIGENNKGAGGIFLAQGVATYLDGAFGPSIVNGIQNPFTKTPSPSAPLSETAPPVVNGTNSSSNLLGALLANSIVQAEINNGLPATARNPYGFALYSNYPISADNLCCTIANPCNVTNSTTVGVASNLITGSCYTTQSSGQPNTGSTVYTGSQPAATQSYANVLSLYPGAQSNQAINLWDAILTGAQITTVQAYGATNDGYMQLSNPGTAAFSPPTLIVDTTNGAAASVAAVNTAFSSGTGLVALTSYVFDGALASGSVAAPTGTPNVELRVGTRPMAGKGIQFAAPTAFGGGSSPTTGTYQYNASTGVMTVYGYQGAISTSGTPVWSPYAFRSALSINMTTCAEGSDVYIALDADPASTTPAGASGTLYCGKIVPVTASQSAPKSQPSLVTLVSVPPGSIPGTTVYAPDASQIPTGTALVSYASGTLSVTGYGYTNTGTAGIVRTASFYNGSQSIDVTGCAQGSAVTLTIYPIGTDGEQAYGYLTCQSPPTLPYGACTNDPYATGGLFVAITGAPDAQGDGATFKLACACIPQYLGGSSSPTLLGEVPVGATSDNPTAMCAQ